MLTPYHSKALTSPESLSEMKVPQLLLQRVYPVTPRQGCRNLSKHAVWAVLVQGLPEPSLPRVDEPLSHAHFFPKPIFPPTTLG